MSIRSIAYEVSLNSPRTSTTGRLHQTLLNLSGVWSPNSNPPHGAVSTVPRIETLNPRATPLQGLRIRILALGGPRDESTNESHDV